MVEPAIPLAEISHSMIGATRGLRAPHQQQALTAELLTARLTCRDQYHNVNYPLNPFPNPLETGVQETDVINAEHSV
jgi:hypothetical protein